MSGNMRMPDEMLFMLAIAMILFIASVSYGVYLEIKFWYIKRYGQPCRGYVDHVAREMRFGRFRTVCYIRLMVGGQEIVAKSSRAPVYSGIHSNEELTAMYHPSYPDTVVVPGWSRW